MDQEIPEEQMEFFRRSDTSTLVNTGKRLERIGTERSRYIER